MTFEHKSGQANTHDRAVGQDGLISKVFGEGDILQGANLNESQTIARERHARFAKLIARDGDIVSGASAIVDQGGGEILLTPGEIWISPDILKIASITLYGVSMTGEVVIGVRRVTTFVDAEADPLLNGLVPGIPSEGEPGAGDELVALSWAVSDDAGEGDFFPVYRLSDGVIIDQAPPPSLSGFNSAIARATVRESGNFISEGCQVVPLGLVSGSQEFSIREGVAVILGYPRTRRVALRHKENEAFDTKDVDAEGHVFSGSSANVFSVFHKPIAAVSHALVTKQKTVTVTRGGTGGGTDNLPDNSVTSIVGIVQGGTTYVDPADFLKAGDSVDWSPAGIEPASGSSYDVTYQYRDTVSADENSDTTVTFSGGIDGGEVLITYDYKLPRIDRLCLDRDGRSVYLKGISANALYNCLPPLVPENLLSLARIKNTWDQTPAIENDGVRAYTMADIARLHNELTNQNRLVQLERLKSTIDQREPAAKLGMFVDPFLDDYYRDQGEAQTAAVGGGVMELAIAPTFFVSSLSAPVTLDFDEEVIITQEIETLCEKINPYQNFEPMPASMALDPAADFWVEEQTQWASPVTRQFTSGPRRRGPLTETSETLDQIGSTSENIEFLRQISVQCSIAGFAVGEILSILTFDGVDILPEAEVVADAQGEIDLTFLIPVSIPAGSKPVLAEGAGGTKASGVFVGQGTLNVEILRRVTTIRRWGENYADPQAQTFSLQVPRQIVGVDFKICAIGDDTNDILVEHVGTTDDKRPDSEDLRGGAYLSMLGEAVGWKSARYGSLVLAQAGEDAAFVIKTDDANHSIAMARLGDFDEDSQQFVGRQPYIVGDNFSSANAKSWVDHPERDITFRMIAAKFNQTTKTVPLGSFDLVNASDLLVRAAIERPSADCDIVFKVTRANNDVWWLAAGQVLALDEYVTETVQLHAVLTGTEQLSPVLYAPVMFIAGEMQTSGTYITRAFDLGSVVKLSAYYKAMLPAGSNLTIEYDEANDTWATLTQIGSAALADPDWVERDHAVEAINAVQGRLRITISGTPAARPLVGDLGASIT